MRIIDLDINISFSPCSKFRYLLHPIKRVFVSIIFVCFLLLNTNSLNAQESMIPELSYPFLEKLIYSAKQNYPLMAANLRKVNFANYNLKKAKLSWFDFFTLSAFYSPNTSVTLTNATLTGVQIGLFINFSNIIQKPTLIKQSKEEVAIAQLTADQYEITLETDVKNRYFKYMQTLTVLRVQNQNAIDIEALYKQIKFKYERGEETLENYTKLMIQNADQKQKIIDAESAVLIAKTTLEELVGKKLEEIK
ncbi:MAG: TolC family protein [Sediminibacterium sp.]|uniref:TolC family protein n=1 Tax=Sediminibacterium sp. TaxID=1917865 RepID=UPI0027179F3F|nr:TolC family protein [Sediminibacterium sp.]MDO8996949.1 TolC family protein [Sediminibacterium sp.]